MNFQWRRETRVFIRGAVSSSCGYLSRKENEGGGGAAGGGTFCFAVVLMEYLTCFFLGVVIFVLSCLVFLLYPEVCVFSVC